MLRAFFKSSVRGFGVVLFCGLSGLAAPFHAPAQDAATAARQPLDHVIGSITALDAANNTLTVAEDKTGTSYSVQLADAKSLLKVAPGAKDLTNAQRITSQDLQVGDRVDVRGRKGESGSFAARGLVLMSARELQQSHQEQAAAWQKATAGTVSAVDAANNKITIQARSSEGPKTIAVETSANTEFTRFSPDNPKAPAASQLAQIEPGDQLRVIGDATADGSAITARRVYTGAFRTLAATVVSLSPDGKSLVVTDLATKKPVAISLHDDSTIHRLPPDVAARLAHRFNPAYKGDGTANGGTAGAPRPAATGGQGAGSGDPSQRPQGGGAMRSGDISQLIERLPKIGLADLKPGDALVVSGVALTPDNSKILAGNLIAGVEPILQSAPQQRQGGGVASDWGLSEMSAPTQ